MPDHLEPPDEHKHHRWHWVETEHGMMCASWYPVDDYRRGMWDISGHTKDADNPFVVWSDTPARQSRQTKTTPKRPRTDR